MRTEPSFLQIDDILVSSEILTECFACDYGKCKGVCCIIGDSGAPLEESECGALETEYPRYRSLMTEEACEVVARDGHFTVDVDGDLVTPLVRDREACVYTCMDDAGNCFCAVERSFFNGGSRFRKPISCWLYPIRVTRLSSGMTALNLHRWDICRDAFAKGRREGIPVFRFLKEPIVCFFGADFYDALEAAFSTWSARS